MKSTMSGEYENKRNLSNPFFGHICLAPLLCSIRLIIAFIGFFGMIIHFSQKSNVSIALVCMVNHSAIESRYVNTTSSSNLIKSNECTQIQKQNHIVHMCKQTIHLFKTYCFYSRMALFFGRKTHKVWFWVLTFGVISQRRYLLVI